MDTLRMAGGLACGLALAGPAIAQNRVHRSGEFVVRANVIPGSTIAESLERHGIRTEPDRSVLTVVVLKQGDPPRETVAAEVKAEATDPLGRTRTIVMRPFEANERVSYVGTVPVLAARESLDFEIEVKPRRADDVLTMRFTEFVTGGLADQAVSRP